MLRERLEEMQVRGEDLTEEDVSLISQLEGENQINEQRKDEEREVRNTMQYQKGITDSDRLKNIERVLLHQTSVLTELLRLNQPSISRDAVVVTVHPAVLLNVFMSTAPALLRVMSSCLLQLADGVPVSQQLQRILSVVCERYNNQQCETDSQGNIATDQILQHQRNADVDNVSVTGVARISDLELKDTVAKTVLAVNSILDDSVELNEETVERLRDVVVSNVAALFTNVPRSMLDSQLGHLVADVMISYMHKQVADVADLLSADIVRILSAELDFYHLINSLNYIPDPCPVENDEH